MVDVSTCYISCGCNNSPHAADWGKNGLVCYGSCNSVAIYQPQFSNPEEKASASILCSLKGHKAKVNCVRWIRTNEDAENEIVSGSVDKTAIVWKYKNNQYVLSQVLSGHNGSVTVVDALEVPNLKMENKTPNNGVHTLMVTSSADSTVIVWHRLNSEDFENIQTLSFKNGFALDVSLVSVANSSGSSLIVLFSFFLLSVSFFAFCFLSLSLCVFFPSLSVFSSPLSLCFLPLSLCVFFPSLSVFSSPLSLCFLPLSLCVFFPSLSVFSSPPSVFSSPPSLSVFSPPPSLSKLKESAIMACGCDDQKVHLYVWQSNQFMPSLSLFGHEDWVRGVQFCTDDKGDVLLASCGQDYAVRIWCISPKSEDNNDNAQETSVHELPLTENLKMKGKVLNFHSKGIQHNYTVTLESVLHGHEGWIYSVHWHPTIKTENGYHQPMKLLTASMDKTMIIWAPDEDAGVWVEQIRVGEVGGNTLGLYGGVFSPQGDSILAHGYQGALHQWTLDQKQNWIPAVTSGGHFKGVEDIAWDPVGGHFLLSVSTDQTCRLHAAWVMTKQKLAWYEIARPQIHGYDLQGITILNRYKYVSAADEKVLRVFDAPKNFIENFCNIAQLDIEQELKNKEFSSVPEGASVPALGLSNKAVYQEKDKINEDEERIEPHPNELYPEVYFASLSLHEPPTEEHLLQNTLWPETQKLYGHGYEVFSVASDPQGQFLASACKASKSEYAGIILWDCNQWTQLATLSGASLTVTQLAFSHDGQYLLSVSRDRTWTLYKRTQDGDLPFKMIASVNKKTSSHSRVIWACCWSHNDKFFLTASRDKKVTAWKCPDQENDSPKIMGSLVLETSVTAVDMAPTLTPCQRYLVALGLESGLIYLYTWSPDSETTDQWQQLTVLDTISHHLTVKRLRFRHQLGILGDDDENQREGKNGCKFQLASCSDDHSVRIFNIQLSPT
ncbi:ELP2 [Acanthosepion pharaonis]|uniref:Elongator complex protein 2 n=1 Tax=Acanthosepion pharaonis TaxID=158019 RepID=A0A812BKT1_ACAPH|nr:ELP2 [Sepia pharaonis]